MRRLILVALIAGSISHAQEQIAPQSTQVSPIRVQKLSLRPADSQYPSRLAAAGVQGTVEILAKLGSDGAPTQVEVSQTSRSEDLDLAAINLVKTLSFRVKADSASAPLLAVIVPVEFMRDTVSSLPLKSCKDFNLDYGYFRSAFPEKKAEDMPVINMAVGFLFLSMNTSNDKRIAYVKSLKQAIPAAISACSAQPEAKFLDLLRQAASEASNTGG